MNRLDIDTIYQLGIFLIRLIEQLESTKSIFQAKHIEKDTSFIDIYCTRKEYYTKKMQMIRDRVLQRTKLRRCWKNTINDCQRHAL